MGLRYFHHETRHDHPLSAEAATPGRPGPLAICQFTQSADRDRGRIMLCHGVQPLRLSQVPPP
jgi:hypothetical protein